MFCVALFLTPHPPFRLALTEASGGVVVKTYTEFHRDGTDNTEGTKLKLNFSKWLFPKKM
jgi:hypothetical protein